ncbi:DUF1549 and DUF1553 domain-containing protein [Fuerstiella marisgermanici]|uniref:DUF1549 domain-containing protein n=1 Tax=Fuerstiella marisgermanici TaxID=1891926 RepID=A0A1P8WGI2_9PLAN|nr:DUF1549 and DUF1553 domain-containing protein [Fuerstiella marisgermanici]APZ93153.1 hypothetical protein Fuma_02769 [Fuerstiella marisgermanici]
MRKIVRSVFVIVLILQCTFLMADEKKKKPVSKVPRGSGTVDWGPVAPVDAASTAAVRDAAAKIDRMLEDGYRRHEITPNATLSDSLFCRRAYLEIGGRIPRLDEIGVFVQSRDRTRREKLIDDLLGSHDHVSHMFNYWADILRLQDHPINGNQLAQPYHEWIKDCIRTNKPYDEWVREMLTAEGRIWQNPAVGFAMRDSNMELDAVDNMVQVFLGTQIGCAQCHDHPFDHWTQREYYEMSAYWYGVRTRAYAGDKKRFTKGNPLSRLRNELKKMDPDANTGGNFSRVINANLFEVWEQPRSLRLPHDYQYEDAKPKEVVKMKPIFGDAETVTKGKSSRQVLADWMTSQKNPRFAKNMANRLWKKAFGIGLIEPVDDIRDDSVASNPDVLDFLTSELIRSNFDTRRLQRTIFYTKAWQREATASDVDLSEPYYFPGPVLRRMTAEQIWDSLLTLAVYNPQSFTRPSTDELGQVIDMDLDKATVIEVQTIADEYNKNFSSGAQRTITRKRNSYKGMTLARASELSSPLPPNHFLRQFGQSDRELIASSGRDGSVSQILTMFNGEITHMMLERGSVIYDTVLRAPTFEDRVDAIFYSILSRPPRTPEQTVAKREINSAGSAGYGNVIWALINTKEFLFIQ